MTTYDPHEYAREKIHDAVSAAIRSAMGPKEFKRTAAESWQEILKENAKDAVSELAK